MIAVKLVFPLIVAACLGSAGYAYYVTHRVEVTVAIPTPPPSLSSSAPAGWQPPRDLIGSVRNRTVVPHDTNPWK